jgi:hypothetical protein
MRGAMKYSLLALTALLLPTQAIMAAECGVGDPSRPGLPPLNQTVAMSW